MKRFEKRRASAAFVLIVLLVGTAAAAAGCGSQANADGGPIKLTEADDGKTVVLRVGDEVQVSLEGNMTTGYGWTAKASDAVVVQQQGEPAYVQDNTEEAVVGAGGTFTFTFKATAAGEATLNFEYARPFEQGVAPIETFTVIVTVE